MCYNVSYGAPKLDDITAGYSAIDFSLDYDHMYQLSAFAGGKVPVIAYHKPQTVGMLGWGFVPRFAKDAKDAAIWKNRSYNCRLDSLRDKLRQNKNSMFKPSVNKPCVLLLDGFYEFHTMPDGNKVPYFIQMQNENTFAVAGLVASWRDFADPDRIYHGVTLGTTEANGLLSFVHNKPKNSEEHRMPAILAPQEIGTWLDTDISYDDRLSLIRSFPADGMKARSVVNFNKKEHRIGNVPEVQQTFDHHNGAPVQLSGAAFA